MDKGYSEQLRRARTWLEEADAVIIGAGAGLSAAAGHTYEGERFTVPFADFIKRYGLKDMYTAGFYPFETEEEKWAYWSRHILINRYDVTAGRVYVALLEAVQEKAYFVLTTNVDHQFQLAGFDEKRIFATQGDYGFFQCKRACHDTLYDNEAAVRRMVQEQRHCRIPTELVPKCPICGGPMEVNLRCDRYFVEDAAWHEASERYRRFVSAHSQEKLLFLELGVGLNTPGIIKYPFVQMTGQLEQARLVTINLRRFPLPEAIAEKSCCIVGDIAEAITELR